MMTGRTILGAVCLAGSLLTFSSCVVSPADPEPAVARPVSPEQALARTIDALTRAIENRSTHDFFTNVSDRYSPSSLQLKTDIDQAFETWSEYRFEVESDRTDLQTGRATAVVRWRRERVRRVDGHRELTTGRTELQFTSRNGTWKLNQQVGDVLFGK